MHFSRPQVDVLEVSLTKDMARTHETYSAPSLPALAFPKPVGIAPGLPHAVTGSRLDHQGLGNASFATIFQTRISFSQVVLQSITAYRLVISPIIFRIVRCGPSEVYPPLNSLPGASDPSSILSETCPVKLGQAQDCRITGRVQYMPEPASRLYLEVPQAILGFGDGLLPQFR